MSSESFEEFRHFVLLNPRMQELLRAHKDHSVFASQVVRAGKEAGFDFSEADVMAAMHANRRVWLERWLS